MARHFQYDPDKVKELRMKVIDCALDVLDGKDVSGWSQYKKDLVLKMSSRVLPVLNAGRDDDKDLVPTPILNGLTNEIHSNDSIKENTETKETP